ncbi:MAG: HlyD family type I secretion periplasmic adaptor subunit [Rhodospirillales bacterium]
MNEMAPKADNALEQKRGVKRGDRQARFLAQSVILEEGGSSRLVRVAMMTICLVIMGFIAWAAITEVEEVAVTSGEVVPSGQVQTIQHLEGGIIKEILVKEGDLVEAGQSLIRMEPSAAIAELQQARARYAGLLLKAERLRAVGTGREPDFSMVGPSFPDLVRDQTGIYESQLQARENKAQVLRDQIRQREADLSLYEEQQDTLLGQLRLLEQELELRQNLFDKGLTSKVVLLDIQRQVNTARGDVTNNRNEIDRTIETLEEARTRLAESQSDLREQALNEMGGVTQELAQVRENLTKLEDRVRRLEVRAPVRGYIKGLQTHTVGGVVPPGALLMELVPMDRELIVEVRITTRDVGHVQIGQPVTIKVVTYDYARYGGITGELQEVSATTFLDEQGEPYYKGIVKMDRAYVGFDPAHNRVRPGMTVQADVNTGKKTLLSYLLKPVTSSVSEAFRER